jgi:hypothetical protein
MNLRAVKPTSPVDVRLEPYGSRLSSYRDLGLVNLSVANVTQPLGLAIVHGSIRQAAFPTLPGFLRVIGL